MAGYPISKADVDSRAGFLALTLRDTFAGVAILKEWLDGQANLTGLGYSSEDEALLRAAITDLSKLGNIGHGQDTQAQASDFFWNAKHLTGLS